MHLSFLQLFIATTILIALGGLLGYRLQKRKITTLKKELKIKDASLKGMWSAQDKKHRKESKPSTPLNEGNVPTHISDSFSASR